MCNMQKVCASAGCGRRGAATARQPGRATGARGRRGILWQRAANRQHHRAGAFVTPGCGSVGGGGCNRRGACQCLCLPLQRRELCL